MHPGKIKTRTKWRLTFDVTLRSSEPTQMGNVVGKVGRSDVKMRQNELNKDKDSNGGLQSVSPSTLRCIFLTKKEFTIKNNFQYKLKVLGSEVLLTKAL